MRTRILLSLVALAVVAIPTFAARANTMADPEQDLVPMVFSSPINGGCYIAGPNDCRLHVDPFTINVASGRTLVAFRLQANGQTFYDFRTDVSNPPPSSGTTYGPSLVMQDFGAVCGRAYVLNLLARDSGDANFLNAGQTAEFTCPTAPPQ